MGDDGLIGNPFYIFKFKFNSDLNLLVIRRVPFDRLHQTVLVIPCAAIVVILNGMEPVELAAEKTKKEIHVAVMIGFVHQQCAMSSLDAFWNICLAVRHRL